MIKLLQVDNFFKQSDVYKLFNVVNNLPFVEKEYGFEIDNFNLIVPDLEPIFSNLLGEPITIEEDHSGVFRRPKLGIHFESFSSSSDWIFAIALEPTTFNLLFHEKTGARSALEEHRFNYKNFLDWNYYTNILLEPNCGLIFKPWLFHSFQEGIIQIYRLTGKKEL